MTARDSHSGVGMSTPSRSHGSRSRTGFLWLVCGLTLPWLSGCAPATPETALDESQALRLENLEGVLETAHEKFTALAEAMPDSAMAWRPMDGVRSSAEVYAHVAADNYYVPALMGWTAPVATGVTSDVATFRAYQERSMSREELLSAVDASFSFLRGAMRESAEDLDREVVLGSPTTVGDVWVRAVVHLHEHLGQSIAYARANGVVPPWSG